MNADLSVLRALIVYLKPQARLFVTALVVFTPLFTLASIAQPYLLKRAVDAVLIAKSSSALYQVALLFLGVVLAEFCARFGQVYLLQLAGQRAVATLRRSVFEHLQKIALRYFERTPVGRLVTRVTNDVDSLSEFFSSGAVTALTDILVLIGIVAVMFAIDVKLTLAALLLIPILVPILQVFRKYARSAYQIIRAKVSALNAELSEQVQGLSLIKSYREEKRLELEYQEINDAYRAAHYQAIRYDSLLFSVVESVSTAAVAVILWFASVQLGWIEDDMASRAYVGTVVAFYEYIQRFFVPLRDLSQKFAIVQSALASAERIEELLSVEDMDALPQSEARQDSNSDLDPILEFKAVRFGYQPEETVIADFSFRISRGQSVAFVGATGSGKTTITSLALRLYDIQEGGIFLEGRSLKTMARQEIGAFYSVIPQEVFLFAGTIRDNMLPELATPEDHSSPTSDLALIKALQQVDAWDLVEKRGGLFAPVLEGGLNWSAGERQLIAFARALVRKRPILILDEATSSVDAETEARIERATELLMKDRTSLIVAHRLATVQTADVIVVLDKGRVLEQGTHQELLAKPNGKYRELWSLQTGSSKN